MNDPSGESSILYSPYSASDAEEMIDLIADAFSTREPLGIAVGITHAEFAAFLGRMLRGPDVQELTIVARRADTRELVGALVTADGASDSGEALEAGGRKFAAVGSILGGLHAMSGMEHAVVPGRVLHMFMLAVSDRAAGMHIGERLVNVCIASGVRKGYSIVTAECTAARSQYIFRKLEFIERAKIRYAEHEFDGERVFAEITECDGPILMEKML